MEIGQRLVGAVEIVSGLNQGDKVVTHGVQKLRESQIINVLSEETSVSVSTHHEVK